MGLLRKDHKTIDGLRRARSSQSTSGTNHRWRICRFEQMEPRRLLSADFSPIQVGAVYFEDGSGEDEVGDVFEVTFSGGAPGTQLAELVIDTDKDGTGLGHGDAFFDTEPGGRGAYATGSLQIINQTGIESTDVTVADGGTMLVIGFVGFDPGERLVFSVDVDEQGYVASSSNAVAEGEEFEYSHLRATFLAGHYYDATGSDVFLDLYDGKLAGSGLDLPADDYVPPSPYMPPGAEPGPVYTAGAIFPIEQTPLPITIAGTVFEDLDLDNTQDPGEPGLAGVKLALYQLLDSSYVATDQTTLTDLGGDYQFEDLLPGTYQVVESQPADYLSVGASAGTVGGVTRGVVINPDLISRITLLGGENSIHNDFAETRPTALSGNVYHDVDNDGIFDPGETGIGGVLVQVQYVPTDGLLPLPIETFTRPDGSWSVEGLMPGEYGVTEVQPKGYLDGLDAAGTAGGTARNPGDMIHGIHLAGGQPAGQYNFGELLPASISGRVHADTNGNCLYDKGEALLAGVTVNLLDESGETVKTTQTDAAGEYLFAGLPPGVYGVEEVQPEGYFDGPDHVGSAGGTLLPPDSIVDVELPSGTDAVRYDFCETPPAGISGYVYVDQNNNGKFEQGEVGIAGVRLTLTNGHGTPAELTAITDAAGFYRFEDLGPGTYALAETQPKGYFDGLDTAGSAGGVVHNPGDLIAGALLAPGANAENYNFGELRPASLSGRVHAELNGNCRPDPGEPLLAGVTVHLLDASGQRIRQTTTDPDGKYLFSDLRPGTYGAEEIQPQGYLDGCDHVGKVAGKLSGKLDGNDRIVGAELGSGAVGVGYDFCEAVPASISGYVFQDGPTIKLAPDEELLDPSTIRDGQFTPDDKPIAGVTLRLGDGTGAPIRDATGRPITALTNAQGYYEFITLEPGLYTILEDQPDGYTDGIDTPGSNGGIAVNPHQYVDALLLGKLTVDPKGDAILDVQVDMGDAAVCYNFSEVLVEDSPLVIPPLPLPVPPPPSRPAPPGPPLPEEPPVARYLPPAPIVIRPPLSDSMGGSIGYWYAWHLSVINAGRPRRDQAGNGTATSRPNPYFDPVSWTGTDLGQSQWIVINSDGVPVNKLLFGIPGGIPVTGDFNGDGIAEVGVFVDGQWFIDLNGNGIWDSGDLWARLGDQDDLPVVGDWDGDGKDDIGIFGPTWTGDQRAVAAEPGLPDPDNAPTGRYKNLPPNPEDATSGVRMMRRTARGKIRSDLIDHVFRYGTAGDRPVAGDWNGDGVASIGIFRDGTWLLDVDGNGRWSAADVTVKLGRRGDVPVVGDFNRDGIDDLGVYRAGTWHLDTDGNRQLDARDKVFELGGPDDKPVVGDFNGDGDDQIAVYQDHAPQPEQQASQ